MRAHVCKLAVALDYGCSPARPVCSRNTTVHGFNGAAGRRGTRELRHGHCLHISAIHKCQALERKFESEENDSALFLLDYLSLTGRTSGTTDCAEEESNYFRLGVVYLEGRMGGPAI